MFSVILGDARLKTASYLSFPAILGRIRHLQDILRNGASLEKTLRPVETRVMTRIALKEMAFIVEVLMLVIKGVAEGRSCFTLVCREEFC